MRSSCRIPRGIRRKSWVFASPIDDFDEYETKCINALEFVFKDKDTREQIDQMCFFGYSWGERQNVITEDSVGIGETAFKACHYYP